MINLEYVHQFLELVREGYDTKVVPTEIGYILLVDNPEFSEGNGKDMYLGIQIINE